MRVYVIGLFLILVLLAGCTEEELKSMICADTSDDAWYIKLWCKLGGSKQDKPPANEGYGCLDSDGLDYYKKGTVTSGKDATKSEDYCLGEFRVEEQYCKKDGSLGVSDIHCEDGCSDGKCKGTIYRQEYPNADKPDPQQNTCYDADGGLNYATKSYIIWGDGVSTEQLDDSCTDDTTVKEYYCSPEGDYYFKNFKCKESCYAGGCKSS